MTPERFRAVEELLAAVLACEPAARAALLDEACAGDGELRAEVESLLAVASRRGGPLDDDAVAYAAPLLAPLARASLLGSRLGPYRLECLLGAGGMGEVYLASDERLQRAVAVKVLAPALDVDPRWHQRFLREARLASALDHPNVCTIHEVGEADGRAYIVMQHVEGRTLRELIGGRAMPPGEWVPLALQIGAALAAAHERGIVHRDVKATNIVVTPGGQAKVLDFGIARRLDDAASAVDPRLTGEGTLLGTPGSMSPEQASGDATDARSDIFSFGVVLYEMATGRPPFEGATRAEVLGAVLGRPHAPACEIEPELPVALSQVIDRALAKDPAQRQASMTELMAELRAAAVEQTDATLPLPGVSHERSRGHLLGLRPPALAVVLLVLAMVAVVVIARTRSGAPRPIRSLAVLPFRPLTAGQADEALELGMADALIYRLGKVSGLEVRPLAAVRRYARPQQEPLPAGREQRVEAVLDGYIQSEGDRVRVTVQLLRVADGRSLWTDRVDTPMTGLFDVQDAVAERVARTLESHSAGGLRAVLATSHRPEPEAYRLYLLGRLNWGKRTKEGLERAVGYFEQAVAKDPAYAQAYSGLAAAHAATGWYDVVPPREANPRARAAAERALRLAPDLAEAHAVLGNVEQNFEWDWPKAERELRRALELEPNNPVVNQWYGEHLMYRGRGEESVAFLIRARDLDPLSVIVNETLGETLLYSGRVDEAIVQFRRTLEIDPGFALSHAVLAEAYAEKGLQSQMVEELLTSLRLFGTGAADVAALRSAYEKGGIADFHRAHLALAKKSFHQGFYSPYVVATLHAAAGERDEAFAWLDRAVEERDAALVFAKIERMFDAGFRADPRYRSLLARIGFT